MGDFASLETSAVIARKARAGEITRRQADAALVDLDVIRAHAERLKHSPSDFALAERLVRDHATKLAAGDALHLASVEALGATLATFDARLADAARARGVAVAGMG